MNLKKKLTSALSLVLVLSMLLSSAAMATDLADAEAGSASSSSVNRPSRQNLSPTIRTHPPRNRRSLPNPPSRLLRKNPLSNPLRIPSLR